MIDEKKFNLILDEIIDKNDKVIVLYSGIWTFIDKLQFKDKKIKNIPKNILNILEKKITKDKTLFIPAFTGKTFSKKKIIEIDKDLDKSNGIISFEALKRNYYRIPLPIHSYFVFGNLKEIKKLKFKSSWGDKSILEYFSKKNARICSIGLPWNKGCAYLHRFEELYRVPWRYNKKIVAKFYKNKKFMGNFSEVKYCSSQFQKLNYDFKPFIKFIKKCKSFKRSRYNNIKIESVKTLCLNKIGKKIFIKNPWKIIKNKKKTLYWIKNFKEKEIIFNNKTSI